MVDGIGENKIKRDFIIYPGQEKDPVTKIRNGGRTKSGKLRKLNPIFFEKFRAITTGANDSNIEFEKNRVEAVKKEVIKSKPYLIKKWTEAAH